MNKQLLIDECCKNVIFSYHIIFIVIIMILIILNLIFYLIIRKLRRKESFLCIKYIGNDLPIGNLTNEIVTSYNQI